MTLGNAYWVCMLIWLVLALATSWTAKPAGSSGWRVFAGDLFLFLLLVMLGWGIFHAPIHG